MSYPSETVAVAWHDVKAAALYFDRVLPLGEFHQIPEEIRLDYGVIKDNYLQLASEYVGNGCAQWESFEKIVVGEYYDPLPDELNVSNDMVLAACVALRRKGINAVPLLAKHDWRFEILEPSYHEGRPSFNDPTIDPGYATGRECVQALTELDTSKQATEYLEIVFNGLPKPDLNLTSWEDIVSFKNDPRSVELLRSFRLLTFNGLQGKDERYIREYVADAVAALERESRRHRIEFRSGTVRSLLNSKSLAAGAAVATGGLLSQNPGMTAGGVLFAVIGELLGLTLTLDSIRQERASWLHATELGYVQHVDDSF